MKSFSFLLTLAFLVPNANAIAQTPNSIPFPPPTTTPTEVVPPLAPYTLGAGDVLRIDIYNIPEYSGEYAIAIDGTIEMPEVGTLNLRDITVDEAIQLVSNRYSRYIRRPRIGVRLIAQRPVTVAIAGEVNRPGSYTIELERNRKFPTLTEVVNLAEGITRSADVRSVQLRRVYRGREQIIDLNLWELFARANLTQDIPLRDGDTIFVATQPAINPGELRQLADANFAGDLEEPLEVVVIGEVFRPGTHALNIERNQTQPIPTVTQAIEVAGGITNLADIRNIEVRRLTRIGEEQAIAVNLWELLESGDVEEDLILQEGDTIVVPQATALNPAEVETLATASFAPETIQVYVVGEVEDPGAIEVAPNTALNQALLAAGGFTSRADFGDVELVRLNPNGTVKRQDIRVNFESEIDEGNNPPLLQNDIVLVRRSGLAQFSDTVGEALSPLRDFLPVFSLLRLLGLD
ncbi:MAG: SLBB domain-containing protein [Cyanobacteriota bacterium]|nr:SLBB domain-containing protein [Cyanobacteriota bacterium]